MQAIVCKTWGPPQTLTLETLPDPTPKPNEVLLQITAAGVNFPDVLMIQKKYQMVPELPFIPGAEITGTVLQIGSEVTTLSVGDHVVALCQTGAFAQQIALPAAACFRLPATLPKEIAGTFLFAYGTSWHAILDRAALRPHETMLVLGAAGGVGLAAIQIGKMLGAKVVAAASTPEKLAICKANGADELIDYTQEDLRAAIKRTCGKAGPDVIYDPVGGPYTEPAFRSIAFRGRHLVVGFAAGDIPSLPLNLPLLKGASVVGVFWGAYVQQQPTQWAQDLEAIVQAIQAGKLTPHVSRTYTLKETPQALEDMAARKVTGKIAILP